jgi:subtilisin family serine protease
MVDSLKKLGATIEYSDERSGYALVMMPREKLLATLDVSGIAYAYTREAGLYYRNLATKSSQTDGKAEAVPPIEIPYQRVQTTLSPDSPFFAADEIGLSELRKRHPEADGRGVSVAVLDQGFDLLHPALQEAKDAQGQVVPKIADFDMFHTSEDDSGWVRMDQIVEVPAGRFEAAGRTWTAPNSGTYRFGIYKYELMLGPDGNSHTKKLKLSVGVLWDQTSGRIWVDSDGDGSFKNQRALGDFGVKHDIDWFGTKVGEDDNRIPFGVKTDSVRNAVYIRIGGFHGAVVAGPLAANTLTGGLFNGAAPSAQLIDGNFSDATLLATMVEVFSRPDVDLVNRSGAIAASDETRDRRGSVDFAKHVLERMIALSNKPMACVCAAAGTINVTDYAGPEMLRRNRQLEPPYKDSINSFVWELPNGIVNTVLAPSANLETQSRYASVDLRWPDGKLRGFDDLKLDPPAPDGYLIGANNSPAIPVVSGVLADLISEANRERIRYNAVRLNNAIFTGTRLLDGFPLSQQGYGLVNAARSWDQLAKMSKADDPANPELTSFTISRMEDGRSIEVQGFHANLPQAGEKLTGEIRITRRGGFAGRRKYTFSLRGNNGSYELLDREAELVRDKPVRVRFRTNGASGWNIVFLELRDVKADVVMQDFPLSVRVPDVPEVVAPDVDRYTSTIPTLHSESRYVRVDEDVQAVRYVMKIPYTGPENISTRSFPGGRYDDTKAPDGELVDAAHHVGPMETLESLVVNDEPGTQEIFWENRGRPEYATQYDGPAPDVPVHAELTVSKYAVAIGKGPNDTLDITSKLATIEGKVELYNAALKASQLVGAGLHASGEAERTLPTDLAQWRVQVSSDSASSERADVYLLNCTGKNGCFVAVQEEISAAGKTVAVDKPHAGDWRIVVRSRGQVQHTATYTVREALLTKGEGIDPENSRHASGETWTLPLPSKQSDAQYAAFRIAGTPGVEGEKNGLLIAMTPLNGNAP